MRHEKARYTGFMRPLYPIILMIILIGCTNGHKKSEYASNRGKSFTASNAMVSSAHPLASEAGVEMLKMGGNAVDAAVATAFALNVVEPNMSGIGGGGTLLYWNNAEKTADYVDFYPAKLAETYKNVRTGENNTENNLMSTGIPGTVAGLLEALDKYGTLPREVVMAPAIRYARDGFPMYLTLANFINDNKAKLERYEGAWQLFWPEGHPVSVGEILIQPDLGATLQRISDEGAQAFYSGEIAENVIKVLNEAGNPVTLQDFEKYEPQWDKQPLCGTYKDYTVLSAPLPQSGLFILQGLNIMEQYDLKSIGLPTVSAEAFDIITSVLRLSLADRTAHVTDPHWEQVPVNGLISKEYAAMRKELVGTGRAPDVIEAGDGWPYNSTQQEIACGFVSGVSALTSSNLPQNTQEQLFAANTTGLSIDLQSAEDGGAGETTHISVVDSYGNAVSLSTTLSSVFGSGAWVNGFLLNDSGYNFDRMDGMEISGAHPYRVRASTISPTIILEGGKVRLVIGAPGGGRIPTAILQNILYMLEYDLDPIDAVRMPRIFPNSSDKNVQIERGFKGEVFYEARKMGYDIQSLSQGYARLYLISVKDGELTGVADPRHEGEAVGF